MFSEAIQDVQNAIYTVLTGDVVLMGKITGVYDEAPADQPFDFVTFGSKQATPYKTFQRAGYEVSVMLDVWTLIAEGDAHLRILDDLYRLLDDPPNGIPLTSFNSTRCFIELTVTAVDEIVTIRHTSVKVHTINT